MDIMDSSEAVGGGGVGETDDIEILSEENSIKKPATSEVSIPTKAPLSSADNEDNESIEMMVEGDEVMELPKAKVTDQLKKIVQQLSRQELEDIVLKKVIEVINAHSAIGQMKTRHNQTLASKDKLYHKAASLQKQVTELSKAVRVLTENQARNPNGIQKPPQPLKFFRSVGLQVTMDAAKPSGRVLTSNQIKLSPSPSEQYLKQNTPPNGIVINGLQNGNKKFMKSNINGVNDFSKQQVQNDPYNSGMSKNKQIGTINPMRQNGTPNDQGFVDLTDEQVGGNQPVLYQNPNGLQYRIVNQNHQQQGGQQQNQQQMIVSSSQGYHFVTQNNSNGQPRQTIVFTQPTNMNAPIRAPNGPMLYRGPANVVQRPITPTNKTVTPQPNSLSPRNGLAIMAKKFLLPPVPSASIVSVRNCTKQVPPRPELTLSEQEEGIVLSWNMQIIHNQHADISTYQIYACQEMLNLSPSQAINAKQAQWKRVGDVKALPLPMACTLSQFTEASRYHFIVRAVDVFNRTGSFCDVTSITLKKKH